MASAFGRRARFVIGTTLASHWCHFLTAIERNSRTWRTRARGRCACCRCCRPTATGRAPSWPSGSEVSVRTLRRDVDRLRELGYPVEAQPRRRRRLPARRRRRAAAAGARRRGGRRAGGRAAGRRAGRGGRASRRPRCGRWPRWCQVMPPRLRRRVDALRAVTVPAALATAARQRRPGRADRRRAGLPGHRAAAVRLHRRRRGAHRAARRAAPAGAARPPLVPGRLRPAPARLAQLPARPARRAAAAPARASAPRAAGRGRRGVRPRRHRQPADVLRRRGAGRRRRPTTSGARIGRWATVEDAGRRAVPGADEHRLPGLGRRWRSARSDAEFEVVSPPDWREHLRRWGARFVRAAG